MKKLPRSLEKLKQITGKCVEVKCVEVKCVEVKCVEVKCVLEGKCTVGGEMSHS
jgi:uncharacterized low-complexity protein